MEERRNRLPEEEIAYRNDILLLDTNNYPYPLEVTIGNVRTQETRAITITSGATRVLIERIPSPKGNIDFVRIMEIRNSQVTNEEVFPAKDLVIKAGPKKA